jgi:hypothetical protein
VSLDLARLCPPPRDTVTLALLDQLTVFLGIMLLERFSCRALWQFVVWSPFNP